MPIYRRLIGCRIFRGGPADTLPDGLEDGRVDGWFTGALNWGGFVCAVDGRVAAVAGRVAAVAGRVAGLTRGGGAIG
jgi:hypothetical protein